MIACFTADSGRAGQTLNYNPREKRGQFALPEILPSELRGHLALFTSDVFELSSLAVPLGGTAGDLLFPTWPTFAFSCKRTRGSLFAIRRQIVDTPTPNPFL